MTEPAAYPPPQASPQPSAEGPVHRRTPAGWIVAIIGFALLFSVALPLAVAAGPQTRPSVPGEELAMMLATVEAPADWDILIPNSSLTTPTLERDDVRVEFRSGLWEGSTEDLVTRAVDLNVADPSTATIPSVDEPDDRADRTVHRIVVDGPQSQGEIYVIRELSVVVVMQVRGTPADRDGVQADLDTMVDSLWLEELDLSVDDFDFDEVDL